MKQLKKTLAILLCAGLMCGLTGCGNSGDAADNGTVNDSQLMMPVMQSGTVPTMLVMQSGTVSTMLVMQFVTARMIWMAMCRTKTVITELTDKRVKQTEDVLLRLSLYKE